VNAAAVLTPILLFNGAFVVCALFGARRGGVRSGLQSRYAIGILAAGLALEAIVALKHLGELSIIASVVSIAAITVSAATDAGSGYVFDAVTLPALCTLLILAYLQQQFPVAAGGALAAGGAMAALYALTFGRGLGLGDVKLACCIGAALGPYDAILALGSAFVLGGVFAAVLLISRRAKKGDEVRFAPYLAAGMVALTIHRMHV
jgi:prepilin signal peptidase PulO-like enzyme (type II secretory pathway)